MRKLHKRLAASPAPADASSMPVLNAEQAAALQAIVGMPADASPMLLHGVTGSGKCGEPNACRPATSGSFDAPCWCVDVSFSAELLARVPAEQRGRACICRRRAEAAMTPPRA